MHGRDFVLGDIHGCYQAVEILLDLAGFHRDVDRLFLVGDLIDRGPHSEKCLQLLLEPWCYAVGGNHEEMFCQMVERDYTHMFLSDYWGERTGGEWTRPWFQRNAEELWFWHARLRELPDVLHVEGHGEILPFWVVHAELWFPGSKAVINEHTIEDLVRNANAAQRNSLRWSRKLTTQWKQAPKKVHHLPGPVYCGHTVVLTPGYTYRQHTRLDGGAGYGDCFASPMATWRNLPVKDQHTEEEPVPLLFMHCHTTGHNYAVQTAPAENP